jgi:hypothetical protein
MASPVESSERAAISPILSHPQGAYSLLVFVFVRTPKVTRSAKIKRIAKIGGPAPKIMKRSFVLIVCLYAGTVLAQNNLEDGAREFQIWTGGGPSVPGGTSHNGVWNAGVRYGWVLTRPHGPFFLKGRFE